MQGFFHIKNAFSEKSVEILYKCLKIDDVEKSSVKYQWITYNHESDLIKPLRDNETDQQSWHFENMIDYLRGYNFNVNSDQRTVFQLYNRNINPNCTVSDEKLPDGTSLGRLYSNDSIDKVRELFSRNEQFVNNLLSQNKTLYPYMSEYPIHEYTKLFINRPGCNDQEVHCDSPLDNERDSMYIIIPLTDCDEDMGTTVFYEDRRIRKYINTDESWYNKGLVEQLNNDMKNDFESSEYNVPFKAGDAVIFFGDTAHRGTRNRSDKPRLFLHVGLKKSSAVEV